MSDSFYMREADAPDTPVDISLRPPEFAEFRGQERVTQKLELMVRAARQREEVLEHVLLCGPPGLGKTTLAGILATAMEANPKITSGPAIQKAGDLAGVLTNLEKGDLLFIDEIHRLHPAIEEYLYSAMEDFRLDIVIDQGPSARTLRLNLPRFTLVGATTRAGMVSSPLRTRFGMICRMNYYDADSLRGIIQRSAGLLDIPIDEDGASEIAARSRGTPRIANNLLRRVRDFAQVHGDNRITRPISDAALTLLEIDKDGFDEMDKRILEALVCNFNGGPVGVSSLAVAVGEEEGTLEDVHEPYLIMEGYLKRTPQGRVAMPKTYRKLGITPPESAQKTLF